MFKWDGRREVALALKRSEKARRAGDVASAVRWVRVAQIFAKAAKLWNERPARPAWEDDDAAAREELRRRLKRLAEPCEGPPEA